MDFWTSSSLVCKFPHLPYYSVTVCTLGHPNLHCRRHSLTPRAVITACGHRMAHRKWNETKQLPSMLPGPPVPGCSLNSFHFLWAILCPQAVYVRLFLNLQHHCRKCGAVVCSSCSANKMPVSIKSDKASRVCNSCYDGQNGARRPESPPKSN